MLHIMGCNIIDIINYIAPKLQLVGRKDKIAENLFLKSDCNRVFKNELLGHEK